MSGLILALILALGAGFIFGNHAAGADGIERHQARNLAIIDVVDGDYGPDRNELAPYEVAALLPSYALDERMGDDTCWSLTVYLIGTRNYEPSMYECFGDEDGAAVAVILG